LKPTDPDFDWLAEARAAYIAGDHGAAIAAVMIHWQTALDALAEHDGS
jgi:hypothetical protein